MSCLGPSSPLSASSRILSTNNASEAGGGTYCRQARLYNNIASERPLMPSTRSQHSSRSVGT